MDGWIMFGIMAFVIIAQGVLWSWVLIERRRKVPDVKLMNWRELYDASRKAIDNYYNSMRNRPRARR
ncbi:MAG: hypothetical protein EOM24_28240 [Chloroflexia bacterium]|nr:hypothetical protein [Chloroflexia bacterium]